MRGNIIRVLANSTTTEQEYSIEDRKNGSSGRRLGKLVIETVRLK
jgi:hypothetical protein